MIETDQATSDFLVEWYQAGPAATSTQDAADRLVRAGATLEQPDQPPVALTILVAVPGDQTLFAVFNAASENDVIQTCIQAGWPADRISTDVQSWVGTGTTHPARRR